MGPMTITKRCLSRVYHDLLLWFRKRDASKLAGSQAPDPSRLPFIFGAPIIKQASAAHLSFHRESSGNRPAHFEQRTARILALYSWPRFVTWLLRWLSRIRKNYEYSILGNLCSLGKHSLKEIWVRSIIHKFFWKSCISRNIFNIRITKYVKWVCSTPKRLKNVQRLIKPFRGDYPKTHSEKKSGQRNKNSIRNN